MAAAVAAAAEVLAQPPHMARPRHCHLACAAQNLLLAAAGAAPALGSDHDKVQRGPGTDQRHSDETETICG